jgi:hypothetical protein
MASNLCSELSVKSHSAFILPQHFTHTTEPFSSLTNGLYTGSFYSQLSVWPEMVKIMFSFGYPFPSTSSTLSLCLFGRFLGTLGVSDFSVSYTAGRTLLASPAVHKGHRTSRKYGELMLPSMELRQARVSDAAEVTITRLTLSQCCLPLCGQHRPSNLIISSLNGWPDLYTVNASPYSSQTKGHYIVVNVGC